MAPKSEKTIGNQWDWVKWKGGAGDEEGEEAALGVVFRGERRGERWGVRGDSSDPPMFGILSSSSCLSASTLPMRIFTLTARL
jgi:hypothetical protein